jgi:hypothetical protein
LNQSLHKDAVDIGAAGFLTGVGGWLLAVLRWLEPAFVALEAGRNLMAAKLLLN